MASIVAKPPWPRRLLNSGMQYESMRKIVLSLLLLAAAIAAISGTSAAFGDSSADAGTAIAKEPSITPDSFLWGIKDELESISLALTFDPAAKAEKGLRIAEERTAEFRIMVEEGKISAAQRAVRSHEKYIEKVKAAAGSVRDDNKTTEMEKQIEIEKEAEELDDFAKDAGNQVRLKIKASGNLTAEQKALIDALIASMQNQTGSVKIEIEQNKEKIKIQIKQKTGKNETEIEKEIEDLEEKHNLTSSKEHKASETILDAKEEIAKLDVDIARYNVTDAAVLALGSNAKATMVQAEAALLASDFGGAYGLANAAEQLAENAREKIEKLVEEEKKDDDKEHEREQNETEGRGGNNGRVCIQVITPATNEKTGECKEFPTPCDVPDGWEKINQLMCPSTCTGGTGGNAPLGCGANAASVEEKSVWIEEAFDLSTETRQNEKVCKEKNISIVPGGCILQNITFDSKYVTQLADKALETGGCVEKIVHRFLAIKKGETEIATIGTCNYNKVYLIKIKG